jgi:chromosome condensin MukBEF MukE localization factor
MTIHKTEAAKLASARASSRRTNNMLRRLVRVVGDDAGTFTIAEIAQRIGHPPTVASDAVCRARHSGHLTWEAITRRAALVSQHANRQQRQGAA